MKTTLLTALFMMIPLLAPAQDGDKLAAQAVLEFKDQNKRPQQVWLAAATATDIYFRTDPSATKIEQLKRSELATVHLFESKDYLTGVDLFQGRKYEQAKAVFSKLAQHFKPINSLPNSHGVMAGFYEMECMRKLGDLDGLRKALQTFDSKSLTMKLPQQQLELYVLWDAVRAKTWQRAEELALQFQQKKLPGSLRAQVAHCLGLARDGLNKPQGEVLLAYQTAITADAGASELIARDAALRILEILHADEELQDAKKAYDASAGEDLVQGYPKLIEAAGVAVLFEMQLGAGTPLPPHLRYLLKYKQKDPE